MLPEFANLLGLLPDFDLSDVAKFRAELERLRPPAPMTTRRDVAIRHENVPVRGAPPVRVRLYTPITATQPAPGLTFCHGGGFMLGTLESEHERCLRLCAEAGVVIVSPEYRLAPEHPYPAALDDCTAVLDWFAIHAADLGVDRTRLAVGGTSAGAALAAGVTLKARDLGGPGVSLLMLVCPVTDDRLLGASIREFWDLQGWNGAATEKMWEHYLDGDVATPYAAPNRAESLAGLPSTYVVIADLDPLRDEGLALVARLAQDGVATTLRHYPDVPHGFDTFLPNAEISRASVDDQVRTLRTWARGTAGRPS